jgi:hypothetical protein
VAASDTAMLDFSIFSAAQVSRCAVLFQLVPKEKAAFCGMPVSLTPQEVFKRHMRVEGQYAGTPLEIRV